MDRTINSRPPSYPATTAYYGRCTYMIDKLSSSPRPDLRHYSLSATDSRFMDLDTSPLSIQMDTASPKVMSGYITTEEHEHVVNINAKLSQELRRARDDEKRAKEALRDLAGWVYHERSRLMRELAEEQTASEQKLMGAVEREEMIIGQAAHRFLAQEVNKARGEVGLPPLSPEEMSIRLGLRIPIDVVASQAHQRVMHEKPQATLVKQGTSDGNDDRYANPDVGRFGSITDQVDALIAEEKGRLPAVE